MMSSSRDTTSTVGRMWWLEEGKSSKEEGKAGQRAPSTKEAGTGGQGQFMCAFSVCALMLGCLSHVFIA